MKSYGEGVSRDGYMRHSQTLQDTKNKPERVGFEPTNSCLLNDFESFAFDHSATSPPFYKYAHN